MSNIKNRFTLPLIGLLAFGFTSLPIAADKPDYAGIWGQRAWKVTKEGRPWYKGCLITVGWKDIEPEDGKFDWARLDKQITTVASNDLYVMFMVYTGWETPAWIYERGVPKIQTPFRGGSTFPYYLDERFQTYFKRMIKAVAEHVQTAYPPKVRNKIIAVQCPVGASGDPHPYKNKEGEVPGERASFGEGKYQITEQQWDQYQREMFRYYYDQYKDSKPPIFCLFNPSHQTYEWVRKELPRSWVKTGRIGDRYQNNRETDPENRQTRLVSTVRSFQNGFAMRARSEMDLTHLGWFLEDPVGNMYWTQLWDLHTGQDIHSQQAKDLENKNYSFAFDFYSQYAGYKDPRDSHGVWCALRDGLDCADPQRFPEDKYGKLQNGKNKARYLAIAAAFAPFGAKQSDPDALNRTSWRGMNDVGYMIYTGNYEMWLYQIAPNETSQGLWRQGPKEQGYGRFARRFDHASGKDAMYFNIDDRFFFNQPLGGRYPVKVRVVYLDVGTGKWALRYDGVKGPTTALEVKKGDSGRWKEVTVEIQDGNFYNRLPKGADLMLVNLDEEDDTFHMIELTRSVGDRKGVWGVDPASEASKATTIPDIYKTPARTESPR